MLGQVSLRGLGQQQKAIFKGEMDDLSDKDFQEIEEILPGASETLQAICHNLQWYLKSLRAGDGPGMVRDLMLVNAKLDTFGDKEPELWIYLISYCKVPPGIIDKVHADRRKENPSLFNRPIHTPGRPLTPTPGRPGPLKTVPLPTVMKPGERPMMPSVDPTAYGRRPIATQLPSVIRQPQLPTYTDVATPSGLTYSPDLEKQIQSYQEKLKEVYGTPTPTPTASRPAPPPGPTSFSDTSAGGCPPGQFPAYPGGPCRGAVATGGLPGLPGGGGASVMPGALSPAGGMPATSFGGMGSRFPVMNIVRDA